MLLKVSLYIIIIKESSDFVSVAQRIQGFITFQALLFSNWNQSSLW